MIDRIAELIEQKIVGKPLQFFPKLKLTKSVFPYYLLAAVEFFALIGNSLPAFTLIGLIYVLIPLLDQIFTLDLQNPSKDEAHELLQRDFQFRLAIYVTIILDWCIFFRILFWMQSMPITITNLLHIAATLFIFSNLNAAQFAVAHEVFHKADNFSRILGTLHMSKLLYMHFTVQHLYGHHRRVATPEDPASAVKGITVYEFIIKSFLGGYKSSYLIEKERGKPIWKNAAIISVVSSALFTLLVLKVFGIKSTIFFILNAMGAIFYLEAINYIEHYGLQRKKLSSGEYEKVDIRHSWNAPHRFSNYLLFKLQRHSDHHQNSLKPYQTLLTLKESPHLPHGYTFMIILSFFPQSWFDIMDPLVQSYQKLHSGLINNGENASHIAFVKTRRFMFKMAIWICILATVNVFLV